MDCSLLIVDDEVLYSTVTALERYTSPYIFTHDKRACTGHRTAHARQRAHIQHWRKASVESLLAAWPNPIMLRRVQVPYSCIELNEFKRPSSQQELATPASLSLLNILSRFTLGAAASRSIK